MLFQECKVTKNLSDKNLFFREICHFVNFSLAKSGR